jgi:hypothetical protein
VTIENDDIRLTALVEGGHIAAVVDKRTAMSPLWTPPWPSIEPSSFDAEAHGRTYGSSSDGKLLAGIAGHNLCLDLFGGPSGDEATAGMTAHGEGSVVEYEPLESGGVLIMHAALPAAQLHFERQIALRARAVQIRERIASGCAFDRPIGWTQHVTLGPPFLEGGRTAFRASATRSRSFESAFGVSDYLRPGADFTWPHAPCADGGAADLRIFSDRRTSSAYTAHLMDARRDRAFFIAFSPDARLVFGYVWQRSTFPWMGIWEENRSRAASPWCGATIARGMEFGVSPFPETRRAMVDRGRLFDTPTFRWLPAGGTLEAEYWIVLQTADTIPESLDWPGEGTAS